MKNSPLRQSFGFTIIEILVSIFVLAALFTVSVPLFRKLDANSALDESVEIISAALKQAQKRTIASQMQNNWGVYLATSTTPHQAIIFLGSNYASRDANYDKARALSGDTLITAISPDDMREIIFERINGKASSSASIRVELAKDASKFATIFLNESGQISAAAFSAPDDSERFKDARHAHFTYSREISTTTENIVLTFNGGTNIISVPIIDNLIDDNFYYEAEPNINGLDQRLIIQTLRLNNPDTLFCVIRDRRHNNVLLQIDIDGDLTTTPNLLEISADGLSTATGSSLFVSGPLWQ
ncbi:MAG: type II secretion system protein [Patescibacteria group bacterium]|nr:type II secretion system protein [Patescibacteria group bacterium]